MAIGERQFDYQVCYGVADRVTFANGTWLGANIPEAQRRQEDVETCPFVWDFLESAGAHGWELVTVLESPAARGATVRTYFLKRQR
jgi:hypothetical protein